jgi:hypothetical protein
MAYPIQRFPGQPPNVIANVDEEMVLQAIKFARKVGNYEQVLKDEKKVLRQENAALKERTLKLPSLLESELRSVKEDILARMHTVSFKINELIQSYTKFCEEKGAVKCPDALDNGALHAVKTIMPWLETCKVHVDAPNNDALEALLKNGLEKLLQLGGLAQEQNEVALIEPTAVPEDRAVVSAITEHLRQIAEEMNNREKKVVLIREENSVLLEQIKKLSSGSKNIETEIRNHVYASLEACQVDLILLTVMQIPKSIKQATKLGATATRTRDINEVKGYIERCNAMLPEIRTLMPQISEIEKNHQRSELMAIRAVGGQQQLQVEPQAPLPLRVLFPNIAVNRDEEMILQAIEFARNVGKYEQVLKDEKKVLRQENTALKESTLKLPSVLQLELRSVQEDILAKMHTVSFKINEAIQLYTKFHTDFSIYNHRGALAATDAALTYLKTSKAFADAAINREKLEELLTIQLEKLLKSKDVEPKHNEVAVVELAVAPGNNVFAPAILARFRQMDEKIKNREKKVALIKADNSALQQKIEKLKFDSQNIGKAAWLLVEIYSLEPCLKHLQLLQRRIPEAVQRLTDAIPKSTRTREKNEFKGYIERCNVMQPEMTTLISQIQEVAQTIKGAN